MLKVLRKAKSSIGLFFKAKALLSEKSYYPEEPNKSKLHVFLDQLAFIWKYGYFEKYYYAYGFDRKSMDLKKIDKAYIVNEMAFINSIDSLMKPVRVDVLLTINIISIYFFKICIFQPQKFFFVQEKAYCSIV